MCCLHRTSRSREARVTGIDRQCGTSRSWVRLTRRWLSVSPAPVTDAFSWVSLWPMALPTLSLQSAWKVPPFAVLGC